MIHNMHSVFCVTKKSGQLFSATALLVLAIL